MKTKEQIEMAEMNNESQFFHLKKAKINVQTPPKSLTSIYLHGNTLYLGTRTSKLYIYRLQDNNLLDEKVIVPHCQIVSSITANDTYFVTIAESDDEMPVSVWDTKTKMFITALKNHQYQVSKAIFLSEPGWLATSSWDCTVKIWDLRDILHWQLGIKTLKSQYPVLTIEQVSSDVIAFGGDDCYINFWNWRNLEFLGKYFGHAGSVTLIYAQLPYILTAGGDHKLKQWQFKSDQFSIDDSGEGNKKKQNQASSLTVVRMTREMKKNYDSSIFLVRINEKEIFLLDRHGARFLHRFGSDFVQCANDFQYNENITGMVNHNGTIYVTTTKGELRCFEIEMVKNPFENT